MIRINPLQSLREPGFTRKLTIAFGVVIVIVALTIPLSLVSFAKIRTASENAKNATATLEKVGEFQRGIVRMRVKSRDFAATSGTERARARNDLAQVLQEMSGEARCISAPGKCKDRGADYESLPRAEREQWSNMIERASAIHSQFRKEIGNGQVAAGVEQFDERMRLEVEEPAEGLGRAVRDRGREAHRKILVAIAGALALLVAVILFAVALATLLAYWVPRSMMRKVDELRKVAHQIANGDLTARVNSDKLGSDEVAVLVGDFNSMAKSLEHRESENRQLQHQLHTALMNEQERATRDPLTSLRNHRYFQDSLSAEIDRCSRSGSKVTIAVIDLDNFKQVNDRFGHHEGDAVLLRVTKGISDSLRPYDLACRLGGEEFGVIFPETEPEEAKLVLERIAAHVVGFGPNGERATFSAGVATFPVHSTAQTELYQHADEAAYAAKANGKNQVVIYDPEQVVAMDSEERLRQRSHEAVLTTATTLVSAVDQKDPYTRHHSELTAIYAATLARALHMDEETVKDVYRAALLHDVGKIGVADSVLRKPGRLTEDEFAQVKMHPEFSYRILQTADMEPVATWVRHHHEHWNGSGYPFGLAGEDIPIGSRVVLVADAFEAMTSDRVYRRALSTRQALEELSDNAGTQFDPQVVEVMLRLVADGVFDATRAQYGRVVDPADMASAAHYVMGRGAGVVPEIVHQNVQQQLPPAGDQPSQAA